MVLVQKWPFFQLFVLCNKGQQNIFYDILERKIAFLGYKNKKFKKLKNRQLSKGVNPWFWSKYGHCSNFFFLCNKDQENVFYDIQERKIAFLGYKNKKFKKLKNRQLSKGVNPWFWSKNGHCSNFLFQAKKIRKMSFTIFQKEKSPFQAIKTRSSKTRKIFILLKRLTLGFGPKMAIFPTVCFMQQRLAKYLLR